MSYLPEVRDGAIRIYTSKRTGKSKRAKKLAARAKKKREKISKRRRVPTRYNSYIKSEHWVSRRNRYWRDHKRECVICRSHKYLQIHHMVYRHTEFGNERDSDLVALCESHHGEYHQEYGTQGNMLKTTYTFIEEKQQELEMQRLVSTLH